MSLISILENLCSDVIFLLAAIIIGWLWVTVTRRSALINFFGVKKSKRILIYLSHIKVLPFGATGIMGVKMSFKGQAVGYGEMQAGIKLQNIFSFVIPALAEASKTIGTIFLSDIETQLIVSPDNLTELDSQAPFISLGSSVNNLASHFIEKTNKGIVKFQIGYSTLKEIEENKYFPTGSNYSSSDPSQYNAPITENQGGTITFNYLNLPDYKEEKKQESAILIDELPPITDTTYSFVQRVIDEKNRSLFYIAGLSEYATKGATLYLSSNWKKLYKQFGDNTSFLVLLKFSETDIDKWSIVFEKTFKK